MDSSTREVFELPDHALPDHGSEADRESWLADVDAMAPVTSPAAIPSPGPVADEIERLLTATREALGQMVASDMSAARVPNDPEPLAVAPLAVTPPRWPVWSDGVEPNSSTDSSHAAPAVNDAGPVSVRVIVHRMSLDAGRATRFRDGQAIELAENGESVVELWAHERLRARGMLVVVDGRFAVRVTEVLAVESPAVAANTVAADAVAADTVAADAVAADAVKTLTVKSFREAGTS